MKGLTQLDFSDGISFLALNSEDADAFAYELGLRGIKFTHQETEVVVASKGGKERKAVVDQLIIDPEAGSAHVLGIYQRLTHG